MQEMDQSYTTPQERDKNEVRKNTYRKEKQERRELEGKREQDKEIKVNQERLSPKPCSCRFACNIAVCSPLLRVFPLRVNIYHRAQWPPCFIPLQA